MRVRAAIGVLVLVAAGGPSAEAEGRRERPLPEPRIVGPRVPGEERDAALRKYGGTEATEKAVEAGLDWLQRHGEKRGGWDADRFPKRCSGGKACDGIGKGHHGEDVPCPFDDAVSALAALAFLGNGHLPDPKGDPRARHLEATLRSLEGAAADPWALALSTEAFAEAEAMERRGRWREAAERGAERLLAARGKDGAWGYIASFRKGSDVPYTAFAVQALVAARDAGVDLPDDLGPGVDRFLDSLEERGGKLAYLVDGRKYGYTPTTYNAHAAAAIRELLGAGTEGKRHREHMELVLAQKPLWKISWREVDVPGRGRQKVQVGNLSMLQWWYGSLATFRRGGADWSGWHGAVRTALLGHQRDDGCARGSWDPEGLYERLVGGRVFATALGVLMLEQPYRHRRP